MVVPDRDGVAGALHRDPRRGLGRSSGSVVVDSDVRAPYAGGSTAFGEEDVDVGVLDRALARILPDRIRAVACVERDRRVPLSAAVGIVVDFLVRAPDPGRGVTKREVDVALISRAVVVPDEVGRRVAADP